MDWMRFLFSFRGRSSRRTYWLFSAGMFAFALLISALSPQPELHPDMTLTRLFDAAMAATPWWHWPLMALMVLVTLAVSARRWHDQDRSAWWNLLVLLTPLLMIGPMIMFVMLGVIPGTPGRNRFGEPPPR
jgi:uncharacterized membrane protein YhaH (DUF805 family)